MSELNIDYNKRIIDHFQSGNDTYICLHPFYKTVFADHYNWEANLEKTYPLILTKSWNDISNQIGFKSLKRLALGILELKEPFKTELSEFCKQEKIDFPYCSEDRIPENILIPIVRFIISKSENQIESRAVDRFPNSKNRTIIFNSMTEFEIYTQIQDCKYLKTKDFEILLPDYDCPYVLISSSTKKCEELIEFSQIESFKVQIDTKFNWWH